MNQEHLRDLESAGTYLFHGSGYDIETFEPRQAHTYINNVQVPDGKPAIFASPHVDYAWFMAIINDRNCPDGFRASFSWEHGKPIFRATKETLGQLTQESHGFIYIFDRSGFTKHDDAEYFSLEPRPYLEKVPVTFADFVPKIEIYTP